MRFYSGLARHGSPLEVPPTRQAGVDVDQTSRRAAASLRQQHPRFGSRLHGESSPRARRTGISSQNAGRPRVAV